MVDFMALYINKGNALAIIQHLYEISVGTMTFGDNFVYIEMFAQSYTAMLYRMLILMLKMQQSIYIKCRNYTEVLSVYSVSGKALTKRNKWFYIIKDNELIGRKIT